jgi:hypothetical protein
MRPSERAGKHTLPGPFRLGSCGIWELGLSYHRKGGAMYSRTFRNACFFVVSLVVLNLTATVAHAGARNVSTVRGQLTVSCRPTKSAYEGRYEYRLAGKVIRSLSSDCSPASGTSFISIEQVFLSKGSTTLLIVEGATATSQTIRVLFIPKVGALLTVDTLGGDGYALVRNTPTQFKLISPGGGFALSGDRMSTWTCEIEIDFSRGTASGNLVVPFEPGLPQSICQTQVERVKV